MIQMKFKLANKNYILVLLAIVVVVLGVFNISSLKNKSADRSTPTPTVAPIPIDNVNDGVYTNYKYGYRFEYPADKFVLLYPKAENDGRMWIYQLTGESDYENEYIYLSVTQRIDSWREFYEDIYNLRKGESLPNKHEVYTKLESRVTSNYRFVAAFFKTNPEAETEHSVGYSAIWLKENNFTIILDFFTDPERYEEFLLENKNIFDDIVESFEFIDY